MRRRPSVAAVYTSRDGPFPIMQRETSVAIGIYYPAGSVPGRESLFTIIQRWGSSRTISLVILLFPREVPLAMPGSIALKELPHVFTCVAPMCFRS